MSETPAKKTLVQKLAEVMGEVERVAKKGRNEHFRYDYATEADIVGAVREHMAAKSLMMVPSLEKSEWRDTGKTPIVSILMRFTIYDGDSDQTLSFLIPAEGQDAADKGYYKAMTGATKYALLKLFLIPTGDDPEHEPAPKWEKMGRLSPADRKAARQSNEEALEKAPYRDREVDPTTGEIAPIDPPSPEEAAFEPMSAEEARKLDLTKALGQMRAIANTLGVLPAKRQELWRLYCGDAKPMQADLKKVQELVDYLRLAEKNGVDLNA